MTLGSSIDGFRLEALVHAGAMGTLYRVSKPEIERPLVMKVPRLDANAPKQSLVAFQTEAMILPTLKGPHVPSFVAAGDLATTPYLVMEWIEGRTLESWVDAAPLPPAEVVRLGAALADALHSLHQQGVIHLDVKPDNAVVRGDGSVVLIDFGLAHHTAGPDLLAVETHFGMGSAPYVSPEQLLGSREDRRSDLFALGVVLYELATGKLPFGEPDTDARNRLWLEPAPPRAIVPDVPPWLQEIILRCLETRAELRYQSAAHVAFDLREPGQVVLTARARKTERAGPIAHLQRFWRARAEHGARLRAPAPLLSRTPIVLVAIDTADPDDARHPPIRLAVSQFLSLSTEYRLLCLSVIPPFEPSLEHLIALRRWTEPFRLGQERLTLHAVHGVSPASVIVELAEHNHADLVVLGAPSEGGRAWSQSVASAVTSQVRCSVHVVRVPRR